MIRSAGIASVGQARVHSKPTWQRHTPSGRLAQASTSSRSDAARLLEQPFRRGQCGRTDVVVRGCGDRAGRQAQPALDAVLQAHEVDRRRRGAVMVVKRVMVERNRARKIERDLVVALEVNLAVVALGRRPARADDRVLVGEALEEAVHLDDQVGEDR